MRGSTFAVAILVSLPALAQHGSTTAVNPYTRPEDAQAGARLFRAQCAGCHGPEGAGTGAGPSLTTGTFRSGNSDEALFQTISKGVAGTSMPAFNFTGLQIWQLVTHVRAMVVARGAVNAKGDPQAGAAIFEKSCTGCHSVAGKGGLRGPDLTAIGSVRSVAELRRSLVEPDAEVDFAYWSVGLTTRSGEKMRGMRLNEDTHSLQIRDDRGRLVSLRKQDIANSELIRRSPMPTFEGKLSQSDIDNVVAWLARQKGEQ